MLHYIHTALSSIGSFGSFFAPPPVSPMFQAGGRFDGWNEDVVLTLIGMGALLLVDQLLVKPFLKPKSRYFALHAFANGVSSVAAFPDVVKALTVNPSTAFGTPASTMVPNSIVAAIHLYHCVAFPLRAEDIFHHLTFVAVLCGLALPLKRVAGVASGWGCFFLSGLPGGLNYLLLVASAQGWIDKMTEKKWCARINVWVRGPSMTVYLFLAFNNFWHRGSQDIHPLVSLPVALLYFFNGQHYTQQAVESLAVHGERRKHRAKSADEVAPEKENST